MSETRRLERTVDAMGCTFAVVLYGGDPVAMEAAVEAAVDELRRIEELLSPYRPASELSAVNRAAALHPVEISAELFQLLCQCREFSNLTGGAFDISLGALIRAWGFFRGTGRLPDRHEIAAALACVGYRHIRMDPAASTVSFDRQGLEIHSGGIGKGYAVERMVQVMQQRGFERALVAGSGSSIHGLGSPPGEPRGWRVEIGRSAVPQGAATEVFLKDCSISTSGSREKRFQAGGRIYSHILDPRTGYPAPDTRTVSVVAPRATDSEAWTKPCLILGEDWAEGNRPDGFGLLFS